MRIRILFDYFRNSHTNICLFPDMHYYIYIYDKEIINKSGIYYICQRLGRVSLLCGVRPGIRQENVLTHYTTDTYKLFMAEIIVIKFDLDWSISTAATNRIDKYFVQFQIGTSWKFDLHMSSISVCFTTICLQCKQFVWRLLYMCILGQWASVRKQSDDSRNVFGQEVRHDHGTFRYFCTNLQQQ